MLIKKELLAVHPKPLDVRVKKDSEFLGIAYVTKIKKCGKIFIADIYDKKDKKTPYLRFFSDGNNHQFYNMKTCRWTKKRWNKQAGNGYWGAKIEASEKSVELAKKYLKQRSYYTDRLNGILDEVIREKEQMKYDNVRDKKRDAINSMMKTFPELPKGLDTWLERDVFGKYVFISNADKNIRHARCSGCKNEYDVAKTVKHRMRFVCPKCGCEATAFSERYVTSIAEKRRVCVANKVNGQLYLRWLEAVMTFGSEFVPCFAKDEYFRMVYQSENGKQIIRSYDYKFVYPYGEYWREQGYEHSRLAYVYPGNLREVFGSKYYNVDLAEELKTSQPCRFVQLLNRLENYKPTEYLVKMGMYRLASEIDPDDLGKGRDFKSILGVNPQYKELYSSWNISRDEHELIKKSAVWVTEADFLLMRRLDMNSSQVETALTLLESMPYRRFAIYFNRQREIHRTTLDQIFRWYKDYIAMSDVLHVDLSHKSVRFPKDIKQAHDGLIGKYTVVKDEELERRFKQATENLYNGLQKYKDDKYAIVLPQSREDFIREGQSLSHCVGTQSQYFENHMKGERMIFFIRRIEDTETPFVTMEVDMKRCVVLQCYGYGDKRPNAEVIAFSNKFVTLLKKGGRIKEVN